MTIPGRKIHSAWKENQKLLSRPFQPLREWGEDDRRCCNRCKAKHSFQIVVSCETLCLSRQRLLILFVAGNIDLLLKFRPTLNKFALKFFNKARVIQEKRRS